MVGQKWNRTTYTVAYDSDGAHVIVRVDTVIETYENLEAAVKRRDHLNGLDTEP